MKEVKIYPVTVEVFFILYMTKILIKVYISVVTAMDP